ncbi:DUF4173 domain-containing protein [Thioclava atlantica]|uniref:Uncharacterized protein n=1 Tax=Thioclava atlantica TaxID=1317124 RepID=A0A085TRB6_9RHOB|nr:DUF4173 domain-containing protein [Thioclava atlantica]KFE33263.1 hypothetical protein DW2_18874 [Thioclava atlantica]
MPQAPLIPGLPRSLALDGWWLDAPDAAASEPSPSRAAFARRSHWVGLAVLVVLADLLFWQHAPGLSLALFALAILLVATIGNGRRLAGPLGLLVLSVAPVIEYVQALSLAFLTLGLAVALVLLRSPGAGIAEIMTRTAAWLFRLPGGWLTPLAPRRALAGRAIRCAKADDSVRHSVRDWAFPLAGSFVFLALLMQANPVLARALTVDFDLWSTLTRALFWGGMALFIAPLLAPDMPEPISFHAVALPSAARFGLNPRSVLRALVLFNALVAVQSTTDLGILVFGAALPEGMSMAEYAHRGAYPLLATALLAGGFALAARPFAREHRAMTPLLLLWLAQNMVLCGAAMMRLEHYIDAFGLTYLRIYALIWMGLVATGLGLVAAQVMLGRTNLWLLIRCGAFGLGTLYLCAFVNFAQIIAAQNLGRPAADRDYICALGPMAHGALTAASRARADLIHASSCPITLPPRIED